MDNNKQYYVQLPGASRGTIVPADKFEAKRQQLTNDYPDAVVMEMDNYSPDNDSLYNKDNSFFQVQLPGATKPMDVDYEKFQAKREQLGKDYPTAKINVFRQIDLNADKAVQQQKAIEAFDAQNQGFMDEYDRQSAIIADSVSNEAAKRSAAEYTTANSQQYNALSQQRQQLVFDYENNPSVIKSKMDYSRQTQDDIQSHIDSMQKRFDTLQRIDESEYMRKQKPSTFLDVLSSISEAAPSRVRAGSHKETMTSVAYPGTKNESERRNLAAAIQLDNDSKKMYSATKKSEYDDRSLIGKLALGVKSIAKGTWDRTTNKEFWGDIAQIDNGNQLSQLHNKVVDLIGSYENINDADMVKLLDEKLTPSEQELLQSYLRSGQAAMDNSDIHWTYNAGGSIADSAKMMAEMMCFSGVTQPATRAASNGMMKWFASKAAGASTKAGRAFIKGTGKLAVGELRAAVGGAIQTAAAPSTYVNIVDQLNQIDSEGQMVDAGSAIISGLFDSYVENASEFGLGLANKALQGGKNAVFRYLGHSNWGSLYNKGVGEFLERAGIKSLTEEWGEELNGAYIRALAGKFTNGAIGNKEEWSNFWNIENQLTLLASFAPTIGGGAAVSAAQNYSVNKRLKNKTDELVSELKAVGYTDETANNIITAMRGDSPYSLAHNASPYLEPIIKQNAGNPMLLQNIFEYVSLTAQALEQGQRNAMSTADMRTNTEAKINAEMQDRTWVQDHKDDKGNNAQTAREISVGGREGYVVGSSNGQLNVSWKDGGVGFVDEAELTSKVQDGTATDTGDMLLNQYLDYKAVQDSKVAEQMRMRQEVADKLADLKSRYNQGATVNVGTVESPHMMIVIQQTADGVIAQDTADEQAPAVLITWQDIANYDGMTLTSKTDAEIEQEAGEAQFELDDAREKIDKMAGTTINVGGVDYTLKAALGWRSDDNGNNALRVFVTDADGNNSELYLNNGEVSALIAEQESEAQQPSQESQYTQEQPEEPQQPEPIQEDNTLRDFRGNAIPLKADGKVDQNAFWNADPEAWARWKTEQLQDGGAYAVNYIDKAVKKLQDAVKQTQKALNAETDFDKLEQIEEQIASLNQRIASLAQIKQSVQITNLNQQISASEEEQRKAAEAEAQRLEESRKREEERRKVVAEGKVPDVTRDKAIAARERGFRIVSGEKVDRQDIIPAATGNDTEVKFGNEDWQKIKGTWAIVSAKDMQPSHIKGQRNNAYFLTEAQPKDRTDEASQVRAQQIAGNINPQEIVDGVTAFGGAPVINFRGEVIQGNGRTDALQQMYDGHPEQANKYRDYIMSRLADFGIDANDASIVENPVLVREVDATDEEAIKLGQLTAQDTESGGVQRIDAARAAKALADSFGNFASIMLKTADDVVESLSETVSRNADDAISFLSRKGVINPTQVQSTRDAKGNVTPEAKQDLLDILKQDLFNGGQANLPTMFDAMPAPAQKAILSTLYRDIASDKDSKLKADIQEAVEVMYFAMQDADFAGAKTYEDARTKIDAWKRQVTMDESAPEGTFVPMQRYSDFAIELAAKMKAGTQKLLSSLFNAYYDLVQGKGGDLFAESEQTDKANAVDRTFNVKLENNGKQETEDNAGSTGEAGSEERQGSTGNAEGGQNVPAEVATANPNNENQIDVNINGQLYNIADLEQQFREDIEMLFNDNDIDAEIVGVKFIGSRIEGSPRTDSDLDLLVEYKGDIAEDALFNILNADDFEINGVKLDINPIKEGKSGTIEQFLKRNEGFKKDTQPAANGRPTDADVEKWLSEDKERAVRGEAGNIESIYDYLKRTDSATNPSAVAQRAYIYEKYGDNVPEGIEYAYPDVIDKDSAPAVARELVENQFEIDDCQAILGGILRVKSEAILPFLDELEKIRKENNISQSSETSDNFTYTLNNNNLVVYVGGEEYGRIWGDSNVVAAHFNYNGGTPRGIRVLAKKYGLKSLGARETGGNGADVLIPVKDGDIAEAIRTAFRIIDEFENTTLPTGKDSENTVDTLDESEQLSNSSESNRHGITKNSDNQAGVSVYNHSKEKADAIVAAARSIVPGQPGRVVFLNTYDDIPKWVNAPADVDAFTMNGVAYLVLDRIPDEQTAKLKVAHELVSHAGLREILGDRFDEFLDSVWDMMSEEDKDYIINKKGYGKTYGYMSEEVRQRAFADEYIAYFIAEKNDLSQLSEHERTIWQKIADMIRSILGKVTDNDILDLLHASYMNLNMGGDTYRIKEGETIAQFHDRIRGAEKAMQALGLKEEQGKPAKGKDDSLDGFASFIRSIPVQGSKFPAKAEGTVTKSQKGGKRAESITAKAAFSGNDLHIKATGSYPFDIVIPDAMKYGASDIVARIDEGIGTSLDAARLAGDAVRELWKSNDLPQMSQYGNSGNGRFSTVSRKLVALHNIDESQLRSAIKLGGLAMPSIAITKADMSHEDFGNISLIFAKDTVNPTNLNNAIYDRDAWTPTFPEIQKKLSEKVVNSIFQKINELVPKKDRIGSVALDEDNMKDKLQMYDWDAAAAYADNSVMKQAYLAEQGKSIKVPMKQKTYSDYNIDMLQQIADLADETGIDLRNSNVYFDADNNPEYKSVVERVKDIVLEDKLKRYVDAIAKEPRLEEMLRKNAELTFSKFDSLAYDAMAMKADMERNGGKIPQVPDVEAATEILNKKVPSTNKKYREWLEDMFKGVVEKEGIRNERDIFTPSGNRRSFEQTHDPVTLDRVVARMRMESERGGKGFFSSDIFGASANRMNSLDEVRSQSDRLEHLDDEQIKAMHDEIIDELAELSNRVVTGNFGDMMDFREDLIEAVSKSHDADGIYRQLHGFYKKFTKEDAAQIEDIVNRIGQMPVEYFEAKPRRAVSLDEIKAAVMPKNTGKDIVDALRQNGTQVSLYDPKKEGHRATVTARAIKAADVRFSTAMADREFNEQLERYANGSMKSNEYITLGLPSGILSHFMPSNDIILRQAVVTKALKKHGLTTDNIKNLPSSIANPIFVFKSNNESVSVLTELKGNDGNNLFVAIELGIERQMGHRFLEVNDILTIHGREAKNIIEPIIENESLRYADKEKAYRWLSSVQTNEQAITNDMLDSATKVINNFENPSVPEDNNDIRFSTANNNLRIFISNAAKAVEGIQQNKATADQWLAMLQKNGGLKAGEDKWLGLSDWLKAQKVQAALGLRDKAVAKQELQDFIAQNAIQIEETRYAEYPESTTNLQDEVLILWRNSNGNNYDKAEQVQKQLAEKYGDSFNDAVEIWYDGSIRVKDQAAYDRIFNKDGVVTANSTRLGYTSEGLDNKREIALTVPTVEPYNATDNVHFGDAGEGRAIAWVRFGETKLVSESGNGDTKLLKEYEDAKAESDAYEKQLYDKYGIPYDDSMESFEKFVMSMTEEENAEWNRLSDAEIEAERKSVDVKHKKVLVIDEIQSKRHQDGREKGYRSNDNAKRVSAAEKAVEDFDAYLENKYGEWKVTTQEERDKYQALQEELDNARYNIENGIVNTSRDAVPDAPFEKNWHELAMKRMLRLAAEEGYDKVAWTNGKMQSDRYNLGEVLDKVTKDSYDTDEDHTMFVMDFTNETQETIIVDNATGNITRGLGEGHTLSDLVGKSIAENMMALPEDKPTNVGSFEVGGEGMKGFYDQILPSFMSKYGKKWGVKVEDIELPDVENGKYTFHSVDVTPEMKESVMQGQAMFSATGLGVSKTPDEFDSTHRIAIDNKGIVADNLANTEVEVVDVPKHDFTGTGKEAIAKAKKWASEHLVGIHKIHE